MISEIAEFRLLRRLQQQDGENLATERGTATARVFEAIAQDPDAFPVVVPVRNEEDDLPATLLSLARAEALPIVVNNNSTDRTVERAEQMGAIVLHTDPSVAKMGATLLGIKYALEERKARQVGFTDGDTLVPWTWAVSIRRKLGGCARAAAFFGHSILTPDTSLTTTIVHNIQRSAKNIRRTVQGDKPWAYGCNYAIQFDSDHALHDALEEIDPHVFMGDDTAIRDAAMRSGAELLSSMAISTTVLTPGDRIGTLRELFGTRSGLKDRARALSYAKEYGDIVTYDDGRGRPG